MFWNFIDGFRYAAEKSQKNVCLVASIDLAHMGPRYGDPVPPGIEEITRHDHRMLESVYTGNPRDFWGFIKEEKDRRRICGFAPLYTLLTLLEGRKSRLLAHNHSLMDGLGSFVTYASLIVE